MAYSNACTTKRTKHRLQLQPLSGPFAMPSIGRYNLLQSPPVAPSRRHLHAANLALPKGFLVLPASPDRTCCCCIRSPRVRLCVGTGATSLSTKFPPSIRASPGGNRYLAVGDLRLSRHPQTEGQATATGPETAQWAGLCRTQSISRLICLPTRRRFPSGAEADPRLEPVHAFAIEIAAISHSVRLNSLPCQRGVCCCPTVKLDWHRKEKVIFYLI